MQIQPFVTASVLAISATRPMGEGPMGDGPMGDEPMSDEPMKDDR